MAAQTLSHPRSRVELLAFLFTHLTLEAEVESRLSTQVSARSRETTVFKVMDRIRRQVYLEAGHAAMYRLLQSDPQGFAQVLMVGRAAWQGKAL